MLLEKKILRAQFTEMRTFHQFDHKPHFITYNICKIGADLFDIDNTSDGWYKAQVSIDTLVDLFIGRTSWTELDWK